MSLLFIVLTTDFDYHLPPELIASEPLPDRAASRMLVEHRERGVVEHRLFRELPLFLKPEDLLVLNNTRVVPARFFSNDGTREVLRVVVHKGSVPNGSPEWQSRMAVLEFGGAYLG